MKDKKHEKSKKEKNSATDFTKLTQEYGEMKETLQRLQAEFINFRNRTETEKAKFVKLANEELILKLLPVIDNLELAIKSNKEENEFSKGVSLIYAQLKELLDSEGVKPIVATGQFDHNLHEAVLVDEGENNKIVEELQKGYMINDKVLRHAKVKITKSGGKQNE